MVFACELLFVQALHSFVVNTRDSVAVRKQVVSFIVGADLQDRGFADASALQQRSSTLNFRINFVPAESAQERHANYWARRTGELRTAGSEDL